MSVFWPKLSKWFFSGPFECFFCDEPIREERPCVHWMGKDHLILHTDCAAKLSVHLYADAIQARIEEAVICKFESPAIETLKDHQAEPRKF